MTIKGIRILHVESDSPAEEAGLRAGDRILTANGRPVVDELALKFYLSEEHVDLGICREGGAEGHIIVDWADSADPGIRVEEFRTRICNNDCLFCFVDRLPPGARPSLRVKDDDYRLSFLHGNYITLTNMTQKDLRRIIEQRLSPLYVSVHATAPELRSFILGRERADDLEEKLSGLIRGGIRIHAQIVLMPGVNDGEQLRKTIFDLYALYPGIQSAAIVPVGLSDFGPRANCFTPVTPAYSRALIKQAVPWQTRFRSKIGRTFACLADEFYLQAGMRIPGREYYDDFVQIEDGIGMVRNFLDDFRAELVRRRRSSASLHGTLATGGLFYPILKRCMEQFNKRFGSKVRVRQIENRFMGSSITVAGLLGGNDILAALADKNIGDFLIIPEEAIARGSGILVDDLTCDDVSRRLGKPVYSSGRTVREFFTLLFRLRGAHLPEHKASKP